MFMESFKSIVDFIEFNCLTALTFFLQTEQTSQETTSGSRIFPFKLIDNPAINNGNVCSHVSIKIMIESRSMKCQKVSTIISTGCLNGSLKLPHLVK
jgi:hypothetical protein